MESLLGLATVHWEGSRRDSTAVVPRMATLNADGGTQPSEAATGWRRIDSAAWRLRSSRLVHGERPWRQMS